MRGLGERPESAAIVDMVLGLAGALTLDTVAGGVETPEHTALLTRSGCRLAQGWLHAKPLSAADFTAFAAAAARGAAAPA